MEKCSRVSYRYVHFTQPKGRKHRWNGISYGVPITFYATDAFFGGIVPARVEVDAALDPRALTRHSADDVGAIECVLSYECTGVVRYDPIAPWEGSCGSFYTPRHHLPQPWPQSVFIVARALE